MILNGMVYAQLILRSISALSRTSKILPDEVSDLSTMTADLLAGGNLTILELKRLSNEVAAMAEDERAPTTEEIRTLIDKRRSIQDQINSVNLDNPEPELRRIELIRRRDEEQRKARLLELQNQEQEGGSNARL